MKPPVIPCPSDIHERVKYAEESHRMALDLYDYVFPPWRWARWFRQYREIKRRVAANRSANEITRAELKAAQS